MDVPIRVTFNSDLLPAGFPETLTFNIPEPEDQIGDFIAGLWTGVEIIPTNDQFIRTVQYEDQGQWMSLDITILRRNYMLRSRPTNIDISSNSQNLLSRYENLQNNLRRLTRQPSRKDI